MLEFFFLVLKAISGGAGRAVSGGRTLSRVADDIDGDEVEPRSSTATEISMPARHLRTEEATHHIHLDWLGSPPSTAAALGLTAGEIVFDAQGGELFHIPLRRVRTASRAESVPETRPTEGAQWLALEWVRGDVLLRTYFETYGADAEAARFLETLTRRIAPPVSVTKRAT